jgi:phosphoenolpyruvate carboxykinase (GTP)
MLRTVADAANYQKLMAIKNEHLHAFVADAVELCRPARVFVCTDSAEDIAYVRHQAIDSREETPLATEGHTVHFDGPGDLGRDREVTRYMVPDGDFLSKALNQIGREKGLEEVRALLRDSMRERTLVLRFLSLGPTDSVFSIPCVQCTDSWYVAHSLDLLYRPGYEQMRRLRTDADFFRFLHSAGPMDANMVSTDAEHRRIYIDYIIHTIYSVNTQYAGNTVGLKKLALRLTIREADREGWLAEHMSLIGVHGPGGRKTYFAGAFPSACGKTSTAMLAGETILGDDIAYLRIIDGQIRAANAESGIFGIIQNVNENGEPTIWKVLTSPGEVVFSNVLVRHGRPYWLGMRCPIPDAGVSYCGEWHKGKTDEEGNPIPPAAKNARYTVRLRQLENVDPELDNPAGVPLRGIMYGGRDYSTSVPVRQSFDWLHGIVTCGIALETVTTYALVGEEEVPELNMMSIQDFVSIPLGKYIKNNLEFGQRVARPPVIFGVNYFLRGKNGKFLNHIRDKAVWVKWMDLRVHGDVQALVAPGGHIPRYADLKSLFKGITRRQYSEREYVEQFTIRIPENIRRLDRVENFLCAHAPGAPHAVFEVLDEERKRLETLRDQEGQEVSPFSLKEAKTA